MGPRTTTDELLTVISDRLERVGLTNPGQIGVESHVVFRKLLGEAEDKIHAMSNEDFDKFWRAS